VEGTGYEINLRENNIKNKYPCEKSLDRFNLPNTSLPVRVRSIKKGREAKLEKKLKIFGRNFAEQTRAQLVNHVTDLKNLFSAFVKERIRETGTRLSRRYAHQSY
jgi:hypothetical protein